MNVKHTMSVTRRLLARVDYAAGMIANHPETWANRRITSVVQNPCTTRACAVGYIYDLLGTVRTGRGGNGNVGDLLHTRGLGHLIDTLCDALDAPLPPRREEPLPRRGGVRIHGNVGRRGVVTDAHLVRDLLASPAPVKIQNTMQRAIADAKREASYA